MIQRKGLFSLLTICFLFSSAWAQKAYEIKITVKGLKDTTANIANYYGKGQYYKDTAVVNSKGEMIFSGDEALTEGMYSLVVANQKLFDFFVDKQRFSLSTDTTNVVQNMKVKGSPDNALFYDYMMFLNGRQKEAADLRAKRDTLTDSDPEKQKADNRLKELDKEVKAYLEDFYTKKEQNFSAKFVASLRYPEVPPAPKQADGSIDSTFAFRYFKEHFFDDIDFSDDRHVYTNVFHEKIQYYLDKLTYQIADSIIISVDEIMEQSKASDELFKYALTYITSNYERSQQMGMDAVFVHMVNSYFKTGMTPWIGEEQMKKILDRAAALEPLLIGKIAPNIVVKDTAQKQLLQLNDVKSKYTVVYIWSPDCGHCKKATPKLKKLYDKYKDQGVEIFGVGNDFENEKWIEYIKEHDLNWINGSDGGTFRSNFRSIYDVYSTPQTYLLDEDKRIVSKKMDVESLERILEYKMKEDREKEAEQAKGKNGKS